MSDIETITINDIEYTLRKWPALPGFKYTRALMRALAEMYAGMTLPIGDLKKALSGNVENFTIDPAICLTKTWTTCF